jgi:hypothetical protein
MLYQTSGFGSNLGSPLSTVIALSTIKAIWVFTKTVRAMASPLPLILKGAHISVKTILMPCTRSETTLNDRLGFFFHCFLVFSYG